MNLDDEICYCYHVSMRKLINFARQRDLKRASQMSECLNAGTGCGWCVPILRMIFERSAAAERCEPPRTALELPQTPEEYAAARARYREEQKPRHSFDDPIPPQPGPPRNDHGDTETPSQDGWTPDRGFDAP